VVVPLEALLLARLAEPTNTVLPGHQIAETDMPIARIRFWVLTGSITVAACSPRIEPSRVAKTASATLAPASQEVGPTDGMRVPAAEQRLAAYLEASLEWGSGLPKGAADSLMVCVPEGMVEPLYALAKYRVISSTARGDTVEAKAAVVTVARQDGDRHKDGRYLAEIQIRQDTLHWALVKNAHGSWTVCGISKEGFDFGHYGEDTSTTWTSPGGSWLAVRALADSVHRH